MSQRIYEASIFNGQISLAGCALDSSTDGNYPAHVKIEGLRSPNEKLAGLVHFARMVDKIRLHQTGKLPVAYHPNLGLQLGLDGHLCGFLGLEFAAIRDRVQLGGTDEEIAEWCF